MKKLTLVDQQRIKNLPQPGQFGEFTNSKGVVHPCKVVGPLETHDGKSLIEIIYYCPDRLRVVYAIICIEEFVPDKESL